MRYGITPIYYLHMAHALRLIELVLILHLTSLSFLPCNLSVLVSLAFAVPTINSRTFKRDIREATKRRMKRNNLLQVFYAKRIAHSILIVGNRHLRKYSCRKEHICHLVH